MHNKEVVNKSPWKISTGKIKVLDLRHYRAYDQYGYVYSVANPSISQNLTYSIKTFTDNKTLRQFVNNLIFLKYSFHGSWHNVLYDNGFMTDEERWSHTLRGKPYTIDAAKDMIIELIVLGKLTVFSIGEYIPSGDRNHHKKVIQQTDECYEPINERDKPLNMGIDPYDPEMPRLTVKKSVSTMEGAGVVPDRVGGAVGRAGVYTPQLTTRTNAELGIGGTRTPDQAKEILARAGVDAPLDEYSFIPLDNDSFTNIVVNQTGRDAYASYGIIPPGAKDVSFGKHIQSNGKIPVYVRDEVFDSDESIVQILGHEVFEIEELRYAAQAPISVKQYNNLVGDGIYDNLHHNAVLEGDDLLRAYRKLEGL